MNYLKSLFKKPEPEPGPGPETDMDDSSDSSDSSDSEPYYYHDYDYEPTSDGDSDDDTYVEYQPVVHIREAPPRPTVPAQNRVHPDPVSTKMRILTSYAPLAGLVFALVAAAFLGSLIAALVVLCVYAAVVMITTGMSSLANHYKIVDSKDFFRIGWLQLSLTALLLRVGNAWIYTDDGSLAASSLLFAFSFNRTASLTYSIMVLGHWLLLLCASTVFDVTVPPTHAVWAISILFFCIGSFRTSYVPDACLGRFYASASLVLVGLAFAAITGVHRTLLAEEEEAQIAFACSVFFFFRYCLEPVTKHGILGLLSGLLDRAVIGFMLCLETSALVVSYFYVWQPGFIDPGDAHSMALMFAMVCNTAFLCMRMSGLSFDRLLGHTNISQSNLERLDSQADGYYCATRNVLVWCQGYGSARFAGLAAADLVSAQSTTALAMVPWLYKLWVCFTMMDILGHVATVYLTIASDVFSTIIGGSKQQKPLRRSERQKQKKRRSGCFFNRHRVRGKPHRRSV